MLSVEQCKKYIPAGEYTDEEIEQMRDSLYQLAGILVEDFMKRGKQLITTQFKNQSS